MSMLDSFFKELDRLYDEGDAAAVERYVLDTIDIMRDGGDRTAEFVAIINELACFYRGTSRFDESEQIFKTAVELMDTIGGAGTLAGATVIINYAGLMRLQRKNDDAIRLFLDAKRLLEELDAREDYAYASVLNNIALVYQDMGDSKTAIEYCHAAMEVIKSGAGEERDIATAQNNLAAMYYRMGDYESAGAAVDEALEIYERLDDNDLHVAAAFSTRAALDFSMKKYRQARESYKSSANVTKSFFGENADYAATIRNLSMVEAQLENMDAALNLARRAFNIMKNILGENDPRTTDCGAWVLALEEKNSAGA